MGVNHSELLFWFSVGTLEPELLLIVCLVDFLQVFLELSFGLSSIGQNQRLKYVVEVSVASSTCLL